MQPENNNQAKPTHNQAESAPDQQGQTQTSDLSQQIVDDYNKL
jgi:hypothetical protein